MTSPDGYQWLGAAVLQQAVADRDDSTLPTARRSGAAAFLQGTSVGFAFWCALAGLDPALVREMAARKERAMSDRPYQRVDIGGEGFVFRSTSGEQQQMFHLMTELANEIQRSAPRWHVLLDDVLDLKDKAMRIDKGEA
jgi:hypothetical protein